MPLMNSTPESVPWSRMRELIEVYTDPAASLAGLLCDRHPADATAYFLVEPDLSWRAISFGELRESSERFAAALAQMGVAPGDRVATLLGKTVEHLVAILAIARLGAVHVPLFTAFARDAIAYRLRSSGAKVVVCDDKQRFKLGIGNGPESPQTVVVGRAVGSSDVGFAQLLADNAPGSPAVVLDSDAPIAQIYTSGTTGRAKGVVASRKMLASAHTYMEFALDLRPDDVFWNAADPGWAYGLYYGVHGSWCTGTPSVWLNSGFNAALTLEVMSRLGVTNFTAAPTAYRSLRACEHPIPADLRLRCASAGGEPLTPEVNAWAITHLGVEVHDHYGQTEAGMMINNHQHPALRRPIKTASMGQAMPGWTAVVLYDDRDEIAPAGTVGRIAFDLLASPLASFTGYHNEPERDKEKFSPDRHWYYTGDAGYLDGDGYFHFLSRDDDVIIMAGYRIGPSEIESVLLSHPRVTEAAVIAAPDAIRGEIIEAYVVVRDQDSAGDALSAELKELVKHNYAAHAYPRVIHFVSSLPKTPSGKIQRNVLRDQRRAEPTVPTSRDAVRHQSNE
ncbi:AMP-binding protein [Nocardia xishanensis]